jgi:hypothetical protein
LVEAARGVEGDGDRQKEVTLMSQTIAESIWEEGWAKVAASLALECGALREAERLIAVALSGNPPEEIAEELRDLLEQVYFGSTKGRRPLTTTRDA